MLAQNDVFFVATSPFLGDKRSSYGQSLSFVIRHINPATDVNVTNGFGDVIASDIGDVILTGSYTNFSLVTNISVVADGRKHSLSVSLKLYHVKTMDDNATCDYIALSKCIQIICTLFLALCFILLWQWLSINVVGRPERDYSSVHPLSNSISQLWVKKIVVFYVGNKRYCTCVH